MNQRQSDRPQRRAEWIPSWSQQRAQRHYEPSPWDDRPYPCDRLVTNPDAIRMVRSRRTSASADALYLWLCQLRRAPYSYDWLDNFGRRSPRQPDLTLTDTAPGDSFMTIFTLVEAQPGRSITLRMRPGPARLCGEAAVTYAVEEMDSERALVAAVWFPPVGRWLSRLRRDLLIMGDGVMMRKQLATLCQLAERTTRTSGDTDSHPTHS